LHLHGTFFGFALVAPLGVPPLEEGVRVWLFKRPSSNSNRFSYAKPGADRLNLSMISSRAGLAE
jgi:hypothetical protein